MEGFMAQMEVGPGKLPLHFNLMRLNQISM